MPKRDRATLEYSYVIDGQECTTGDAVLMEQRGYCKVISHQAKVEVSYLVEYPNGERKWERANR